MGLFALVMGIVGLVIGFVAGLAGATWFWLRVEELPWIDRMP